MAGEPSEDNGWLWILLVLVVAILSGYMVFEQGIYDPELLADLCNDTASQLCESKGMVMIGVYDMLMQRIYVVCRSDLEIAEYRVNTDSCRKDEGD